MEPVVQWVGGKKRLLSTLKLFIPKSISRYHEIFLGGGSLLFNLMPESTISIEKNKNIFMIYENIKNAHTQLIEKLGKIEVEYLEKTIENRKKYYLDKREIFNSIDYISKEDSLNKTAILLFINKTCFNALYRENQSGTFNVPFGNGKDCKICDIERINKLHNYLNNPQIQIVNNDFTYIKNHALKNEVVYIDPPYYPLNSDSFTTYTHDGFNKEDHDRLIELIKELHKKGVYIILSNSNNSYFKEKLDFMNYFEISLARTLNCKKDERKKTLCEMIITNRQIDKQYIYELNSVVYNKLKDNSCVIDTMLINKKLCYVVKSNNSDSNSDLKIGEVSKDLANILFNNKKKFNIDYDLLENNCIELYIYSI